MAIFAKVFTMYQQLIDDFIQRERLPSSYKEDVHRWFIPLLDEFEARLKAQTTQALVIGINGAQGTGKSTLAKLIALLLEAKGFTPANLSIDDFYLSKAQRSKLAEEIHPLLSSRGVPGTHGTGTALGVLQQLKNATAADKVVLPAFDKATDDCIAAELCPTLNGPVDIIILEGWFVGAKPQLASALEPAINELESAEDADGQWRHFVNQQLGQEYQQIFSQLDLLVMLEAPNVEQVFEWRQLQEAKLRQASQENSAGLMDDEQLQRFIQHFERLTRHCLDTVAKQADIVFQLDENHRVKNRIGA